MLSWYFLADWIFNTNTVRTRVDIGEDHVPCVFVIHVFMMSLPSDWQQWWRNRQTSQDHREEVQEDQIPQVLAHLGLRSSGFERSTLSLAILAGAPCLPVVLPAGPVEAIVTIRGPSPFEFRSFQRVWDAWSWSADGWDGWWMRDEAWYYVSFFWIRLE